jgi:hypothetical protein
MLFSAALLVYGQRQRSDSVGISDSRPLEKALRNPIY